MLYSFKLSEVTAGIAIGEARLISRVAQIAEGRTIWGKYLITVLISTTVLVVCIVSNVWRVLFQTYFVLKTKESDEVMHYLIRISHNETKKILIKQ